MAVMVEVPAETGVAKPLLVIVATAISDEFQTAWLLISRLVPSENVPVAVNCWVILAGVLGMFGLAGLRDMEVRVAEVTVMVVVPAMPPETAVMAAVPSPIPKSTPALLTVATELLDESQVA